MADTSVPPTTNATERRRTSESSDRTLHYHEEPILKWMVRLSSSSQEEISFQKGNGVSQSPFDEEILYLTTATGVLLILNATSGATISEVIPSPRSTNDANGVATWMMESSSSAAFGTLDSGEGLIAYSIVDVPPEGRSLTQRTRVVAVSADTHELLWVSRGLIGVTKGSPVVYHQKQPSSISGSDTGSSGSFVMITHNSPSERPDNSTWMVGHATLLEASNGNTKWSESEWNRPIVPRSYSPPGIATHPSFGMFEGGTLNQNDVVVWASHDQEGHAKHGDLFALQVDSNFSNTNDAFLALRSRVLKQVRWTAATRPVFDRQGTSMYVGVTGNEMRGWTGGTSFDTPASWGTVMATHNEEQTTPIQTAPALSLDDRRIFVPALPNEMHCLDHQNGKKSWGITGTSPFLAEPRVSPDDNLVYNIQSADGRIFSHQQRSGKQQWVTSCDSFREDCANAVRANFDLSSTGQYLYYADIIGRVIALEVGQWVQLPEGTSTSVDWSNPDALIGPDDKRRRKMVFGGIALIGISFLVTAGLVYLCMFSKKRQSSHETEAISDATITTDYSQSSDPTFAPDPYEDKMLCKRQLGDEHHGRQMGKDNGVDHFRPEVKGPSSSTPVQVQTDKKAMRLVGTTSNRIAPVHEDFGFGSSILV